MIATITTFKASGKWYDEFKVEIPDYIPCFETNKIREFIHRNYPQTLEFNYTCRVDESEQPTKWVWFLTINTSE